WSVEPRLTSLEILQLDREGLIRAAPGVPGERCNTDPGADDQHSCRAELDGQRPEAQRPELRAGSPHRPRSRDSGCVVARIHAQLRKHSADMRLRRREADLEGFRNLGVSLALRNQVK